MQWWARSTVPEFMVERHEGTFEISQGIAEILVSTDSLVSSAQVPESLPQSKEFAKNAN